MILSSKVIAPKWMTPDEKQRFEALVIGVSDAIITALEYRSPDVRSWTVREINHAIASVFADAPSSDSIKASKEQIFQEIMREVRVRKKLQYN